MQIFVTTLNGRNITLEVEPTDNIEDIKAKIQDKEGIDPNLQKLVFNSTTLKNDLTLQDYSIQRDATIRLFLKNSDTQFVVKGGKNSANDVKDNSLQKSVIEPSVGEISLINNSQSVIDKSFSDLARTYENNGNLSNLATFANIKAGNVRLNSGSHIDLNSLNLIVGVSKNIDELTYGAFFEGGYAKYKSYNSFRISKGDTLNADIEGSGNIKYFGMGILGKLNLSNDFYTEASIRLGRVNTDYKSDDFSNLPNSNIENPNYKTNRIYYGGHLGIGKVFDLDRFLNSNSSNYASDKTLDIYLKGFYTRTESDEVVISNTNIKLENVNSIRAKLGTKLNHYISNNFNYYLGLAIEREFDSKAKAINLDHNNRDIKSPSLKGNTGIAELGFKYKPTNNLTTSFGVEGYTGKREGLTGNLNIKYEF